MSKESKSSIDNKYRFKPTPSSTAALARMKAAKPRDTAPEKALRRALFRKGLRFRLDKKPVEGLNRKADILFKSAKVAVFVDGCYWHGCPIHGTQSKANADFWAQKINRNKERDLDTTNQLEKKGWCVIRVWEHEDPEIASQRISRIVLGRKQKRI